MEECAKLESALKKILSQETRASFSSSFVSRSCAWGICARGEKAARMSPSKPRTKSEKEEAGGEIRSREVRKRGRPRRIQSPSVSYDEDEEIEEPSR